MFFLQKIFIVLGLTISCVLSESAQDQSNSRFFGGIFGNIFGKRNSTQIGGDGSKPGSCFRFRKYYQKFRQRMENYFDLEQIWITRMIWLDPRTTLFAVCSSSL